MYYCMCVLVVFTDSVWSVFFHLSTKGSLNWRDTWAFVTEKGGMCGMACVVDV